MGLASRNVAILMALLVALHAALAAPTKKGGGCKGGKGGKGRRSVEDEGVGVGVSSFEGAFADALAEEDAESALVLEDQVRARRSLAVEEEEEEGGAAYAEGAASAEGAALQVEDGGQSQFVKKKPCRGKKPGGDGSGGDTTGTDSGTEAEQMQRQREGKSKRKKAKSSSDTTESAALVSWLMGDVAESDNISV
ncbi:hypothetical protein R5R35_005185 [Gryllus longicercus]|uniref:Accessory gland protein n=1 Tax=Gryllus longicercus TaxID=2509291 RepID=A0AAN9WGQ7_9ORTH